MPAEFILVSDGGYPPRYAFDVGRMPGVASTSLLKRINAIALEQVSAARRRILVEMFEEGQQHGGLQRETDDVHVVRGVSPTYVGAAKNGRGSSNGVVGVRVRRVAVGPATFLRRRQARRHDRTRFVGVRPGLATRTQA